MKKNKNELAKALKLVLIVLIVILVSLVSFVGIFDKANNISVKNVIKEYALGRDLDGSRVVKIAAKSSDDSEISSDDMYKIQDAIENRLKGLGVNDYLISQNKDNGEVTVQLTEDNQTDYVLSNLTGLGKFEVVDSDTKEVLLNNDDLSKTSVKYYNGQTGTSVYLAMKMNKDGKQKLADMTNTYVKSTSTDENGQEQTSEKKITLKMDDQEVLTTSFDEPITNGEWDLTMGKASTSSTEIQSNIKSGSAIATLLNAGYLTQSLSVSENAYMESLVNKTTIYTVIGVLIACLVVSAIYMIVKYGKKGLVSILTYVFETALFMLLIRYTNTVLTVSSLVSFVILIIMNHILMSNILKEYQATDKIGKAIGKAYLNHVDSLMVLLIVAVVCVLVDWVPLNGIGLPLFWGLISLGVSNIITKETIE